MIEIKISKKHQEEIQKTIEETVINYIEHLPKFLNRKLESKTAEILGFTNRWHNGWEVDNCNGRSSVVNSLVNNAVRSSIRKIVDDISDNFEIAPELIEAMRKEYSTQFSYKLRTSIRRRAEEDAQARCQFIIKDMELEVNIPHPPSEDELCDPDYGNSPIEQQHLKDIINNNQ